MCFRINFDLFIFEFWANHPVLEDGYLSYMRLKWSFFLCNKWILINTFYLRSKCFHPEVLEFIQHFKYRVTSQVPLLIPLCRLSSSISSFNPCSISWLYPVLLITSRISPLHPVLLYLNFQGMSAVPNPSAFLLSPSHSL